MASLLCLSPRPDGVVGSTHCVFLFPVARSGLVHQPRQ